MPLYMNDSCRSLEDITADIILGRHQERCDIAFIDYLGLIQFPSARMTLYQAISELTPRLKRVAKECRIPIVLLCQLNRNTEAENRSPQLYDLRDSGSIEQDADIVLMLERASKSLDDRDVNMWGAKKTARERPGMCLSAYVRTTRSRTLSRAQSARRMLEMTERQLDTALRTLSECQSLAGGNLRLYNRLSKVKAMIAREKRRNVKNQA